MFSIKIFTADGKYQVRLFLDDIFVEDFPYETPVEVAMKVRQLTEDYMGIGE